MFYFIKLNYSDFGKFLGFVISKEKQASKWKCVQFLPDFQFLVKLHY